jgi:hypothetical protein
MGPDGARNRERLCWRDPAEIFWTGLKAFCISLLDIRLSASRSYRLNFGCLSTGAETGWVGPRAHLVVTDISILSKSGIKPPTFQAMPVNYCY